MRPIISAIFCDDARQEVTRKMTLVGCYGPQMIVPTFPFTLSQLYVVINARIPIEINPSKKASLTVRLNGENINGMLLDIDIDDEPQKSSEAPYDLGEITESLFNACLGLKNLQIEKPSILEAVAIIEGKEYFSSKLKVIPQPDSSPASPQNNTL